jgi:hypothetical protein
MIVLATSAGHDRRLAGRRDDCLTTGPAHAVRACVEKGLTAPPGGARQQKRARTRNGAACWTPIRRLDAGDYFGLGADLRRHRRTAWADRAGQASVPDEPSGVALLQAVLSER